MSISSPRITNGPTMKSGRRPPLLIGLVLIAVAGGSLRHHCIVKPDFHRARAKVGMSGRHRGVVCADGFGRPHCRGSGPHPRRHRTGCHVRLWHVLHPPAAARGAREELGSAAGCRVDRPLPAIPMFDDHSPASLLAAHRPLRDRRYRRCADPRRPGGALALGASGRTVYQPSQPLKQEANPHGR